MLSSPVQLSASDVPLDPYALGLLSATAVQTQDDSTRDGGHELVGGLESVARRIQVAHKGGLTTYPAQSKARGGLRIANPVRSAARGPSGVALVDDEVRSAEYVQLAGTCARVLQGLTRMVSRHAGGPQLPNQFCTTSARLRTTSGFLVQSLGGVAYMATRGWRRGHRLRSGRDVF
jgi:phosphate starvation-inducible PhoH-like protein